MLGSLRTDVTELGSLILSCHSASLKSKKVSATLKAKSPVYHLAFLSLAPSCVRERAKELQCDFLARKHIKADSKHILGVEVSVPHQPEDFPLSVLALASVFTTRHISHRLPMCPSGTSVL